ncbi:MAG: hypothetical protein GY777_13415 [Candidatus Brocadiaceae bacterium]|nr:hypothetical protein [Candidatus Brocadiaceae bacterium]
MRRSRADILADIMKNTKWAKYNAECAKAHINRAEHYTNNKNEARKELKAFDEANK